MFFSSRVVPQTPPSLVKLSASALAVMTGSRTSVPSSDQVPELRNATLPDADTDATADAVSWHAGATTGVPAQAADALACSGPIDRARFDQRLQQPRRQPDLVEHPRRPRPGARVDELRRRRDGVLGGQRAGQPVVQQIGNRDERARGVDQISASRGTPRRADRSC